MRRGRRRWFWVTALLMLGMAWAVAEVADVYLKSGLKLRGDVAVTDTEVVIRNDLGEVRYLKDQVVRIVPLPATQPASATAPTTQPMTTSAPAAEPAKTENVRAHLPPPLLLTPLDIQRLKLSELRLDGPAENLRVRFAGKDQREFPKQVWQELAAQPEFQKQWDEVLLRGPAPEKLKLIAATTGTRHADRITIVDDPAVFATFRNAVLPFVVKGCARTGCHAGDEAVVFRLPEGPARGEAYVYTMFALLDRMETPAGRLIDRDDPEASLLLTYMLPEKDNPHAHPPIEGKPRFTSVLRGRGNAAYMRIRDWINSLRTPHPDYGLDYNFPAPPADAQP